MSGLLRARECVALVLAALLVAMSCESVANGRAISEEEFAIAALGHDEVVAAPERARAPERSEPFGLPVTHLPEGGLWAKWRGVEADIRTEAKVLARCRAEPEACESPAALHFIAIVAAARAKEGRARIGEINRAVNLAIRPMSDMAQYGVPDLWSAPLATLTSGAGDCEDYAIAKMVALREAGLAEDDLRLLIVRDPASHDDHAVIGVRLDGRWLILDNRRFQMIDAEYARLKPLFVLRHDNVQTYAAGPRIEQRVSVSAEIPTLALGPSGQSVAPLLM